MYFRIVSVMFDMTLVKSPLLELGGLYMLMNRVDISLMNNT